MSRLFDGINNQVQWAVGGSDLTGAWTFAMLIKSDAGVTWQGLLGNEHATNGSEVATGRHSAGTFSAFAGGGSNIQQGPAYSSADGWVLLVARRPAGSLQTIRFTKYPIGGSPAHSNSASGMDNPVTQAGGKIVFGQIDGADFFKGRCAVLAEWASQLSDVNVESLVTTLTRANWLSLSPTALWDELDAFATDWAGTSSRTSLVGTTDDADDPTGWASWAPAGTVKTGSGIIGP